MVPISARTGMGMAELRNEIERLVRAGPPEAATHDKPACAQGCRGCPYQARYEWTEQVSDEGDGRIRGPAFGPDGKN